MEKNHGQWQWELWELYSLFKGKYYIEGCVAQLGLPTYGEVWRVRHNHEINEIVGRGDILGLWNPQNWSGLAMLRKRVKLGSKKEKSYELRYDRSKEARKAKKKIAKRRRGFGKIKCEEIWRREREIEMIGGAFWMWLRSTSGSNAKGQVSQTLEYHVIDHVITT